MQASYAFASRDDKLTPIPGDSSRRSMDASVAAPATDSYTGQAQHSGSAFAAAHAANRRKPANNPLVSNSAMHKSVRHSAVRGFGGGGQRIPHYDVLQRRFGHHDLSQLRAHVGSSAGRANQALHSHAYTLGEHIAFASSPDLRTTAHEVVHALHQRAGIVPDRAMGRPGDRQEQQADNIANAVASGKPVEAELDQLLGAANSRSSQAVLQLAPNQAGTTDPSHLIQFVQNLEARGLSQEQILDEISSQHAGNTNRYFYTDTYGWVDIRHFGAAASYASSAGSVIAEGLGLANEAMQWVTEWGNDYRSGFSPEDVPSNAAGASFGDDYVSSTTSLSQALQQWMDDHGARPQSDWRTGWNSLPATDPAVRGGADRGSSNASRTQSSVGEEIARPFQNIAYEASKALDWRNWYQLGGM